MLAEFTSGLGNGVLTVTLPVVVALFVVNGEVAIKLFVAVLSAATLPPYGRPEPVAVKIAVLFVKIFVVSAELVPHLKLDILLTMMLWLRLKSGLGCPCEA